MLGFALSRLLSRLDAPHLRNGSKEEEANNLFGVESGPHRPLLRFYRLVKFPHHFCHTL